ncbi:MAG: NfeD family protein [Micavibrio sp.]
MDFMNDLAYWHWLVFGLVLVILEIFVPAAIFLWPGIAALITAAIAFMLPDAPWTVLVLVWAFFSVALAFGWQVYKKLYKRPEQHPTINRRGEQYVGRHFTLPSDIVNSHGEIRADDTRWRIVCDHDLPAGTKITVTAVEGTTLRVEEFVS